MEKRDIQLPFAKCKSMINCLPSDMNSLLFEPHMILQNALKICKIYLSGTQNNVLCHPFLKLLIIMIHISLHDINKHPFVPYSNFVMTELWFLTNLLQKYLLVTTIVPSRISEVEKWMLTIISSEHQRVNCIWSIKTKIFNFHS